MSDSQLHSANTLGRPRNELASYQIRSAAMSLYGAAGWSGFNFSQIAAAAEVGKSTIYARWKSRDALLLDAFEHLIPTPQIEGATVGEILCNWAAVRTRMYVGDHAQSVRRILVEVCTGDPAITAVHQHLYRKPVSELHSKLWEFKRAGRLPNSLSITRLVDAIDGSVLMRGFSIPIEYTACFLTEIEEYVETLVADQLSEELRNQTLEIRDLRAVS